MRIAYTKKETKNLGNYENISIEITIEDDVDFANETKDEAFDRISNFVKTKLKQQFSTDKLKANVSSTKPIISNYPSNIDSHDSYILLLKTYILRLIRDNPDNKIKVKRLLAKYKATKLHDLKDNNLNDFYKNLKQLKE